MGCQVAYLGIAPQSAIDYAAGSYGTPDIQPRTSWAGVTFPYGPYGVTEFDFEYSNNLVVNPLMPGSQTYPLPPWNFNARSPSATLSVVIDSAIYKTRPNPIPADGSLIQLVLTHADGSSVIFTLNSVRVDQIDSQSKSGLRTQRPVVFTGQMGASGGNPVLPVTVS